LLFYDKILAIKMLVKKLIKSDIQIEANMQLNNTLKLKINRMPNKGKSIFMSLFLVNLTACANLGVEPWERDLLAKKEMALTSSPVDAALDDHIYFSKEASSGGKSFGGGGCGCN